MDRRALGRIGESAARDFLEQGGYRIIASNFRCRYGELDLIAQQGEVIVFVEVKARTTIDYGRPFDAITPLKQRRLLRLALYYLKGRNWLRRPIRFDAVSVTLTPAGSVTRIEVLADAFGAGG
ncbi:MAG: YraN family protein [bacterium]